MTKVSIFDSLRVAMAGLSVVTVLLSGCGTTSQAERPIPQQAKQKVPSEEKVEAPPIQTASSVAKQNVIDEIDEKRCIFFSRGASTISLSEKGKLLHAANLLKADKSLSVTLVGRANDNGSRSFNLAVADERVETVSESLIKLGVKVLQIKKNVVGGEKLPGICRSLKCRQKMRRVELVFSKNK